METTTNERDEMTAAQMIAEARRLEDSADSLYMSLLAPSMAEQAMRDDAKALREKAAKS